MTSYDAQVRASFFFGIGTAAALFGIGLGGKPNKLALITAIATLAYGNYLNPVVDVAPGVELQQSYQEARARYTPSILQSAPTTPGGLQLPASGGYAASSLPSGMQFTY